MGGGGWRRDCGAGVWCGMGRCGVLGGTGAGVWGGMGRCRLLCRLLYEFTLFRFRKQFGDFGSRFVRDNHLWGEGGWGGAMGGVVE